MNYRLENHWIDEPSVGRVMGIPAMRVVSFCAQGHFVCVDSKGLFRVSVHGRGFLTRNWASRTRMNWWRNLRAAQHAAEQAAADALFEAASRTPGLPALFLAPRKSEP